MHKKRKPAQKIVLHVYSRLLITIVIDLYMQVKGALDKYNLYLFISNSIEDLN